jgi:transposase
MLYTTLPWPGWSPTMIPLSPPVRYRSIDRSLVSAVSLDQQLPDDHPVRSLWDFASRTDLQPFLRPTKAVEGHPGAPVLPAQLLFALWLWALSDGCGSARRLAALCGRDLPYQWLCGGLRPNYHTLADFFSRNGDALHQTFIEHLAALRQHELIELSRLTLDGRKIHANASKDSYHREATLQEHLRQVREHVEAVLAEGQDGTRNAAQQAARQRAARQRQQRLQRAVEQVQQRQQQRAATGRASARPEEARASETDPDCCKMKMTDGGYRLAYNVETVASVKEGLIVSVAVTNQGSDNGQLAPMTAAVQQEQGVKPEAMVADSGFSDEEDIEQLEGQGIQVLMPPKNEKKEKEQGRDPYAPKRRDSEAVAQWRQRMGTAEAQQLYARRAPVAEGVHAQQANVGWRRFRLRGLLKVTTEAWWRALSYNLKRLLEMGVTLTAAVRAA